MLYTQCILQKVNTVLKTITFLLSFLAKLGNEISLKIENLNKDLPLWDNDWIITGVSSKPYENRD